MSRNHAAVAFAVKTENSFVNLLPCEGLPVVERKIFAYFVFAFGEQQLFTLRLCFFGIELKHNAGNGKGIFLFPCITPQVGVYSGTEFCCAKRLCSYNRQLQGPGPARYHFPVFLPLKDNRTIRTGTNPAAKLKSVQSGHHNIQQDQIIFRKNPCQAQCLHQRPASPDAGPFPTSAGSAEA